LLFHWLSAPDCPRKIFHKLLSSVTQPVRTSTPPFQPGGFSCWLWLVGKLLILAFRPISLRIRRRSQPNKSGGPPLIALSLKVQRDIAHNSSLRTLLSVIGVHGVSKENASAKQAEKCYHNHRSHPYATLRHRSDLSASCLTKLVFQKWFHAGEPANNLRPLAFLRFCCGQGT
jgi:hypothetical protein